MGISSTTGKTSGAHIEYYEDRTPLGNAEALFKITDNLLLLNTKFDLEFNRFVAFYRAQGG